MENKNQMFVSLFELNEKYLSKTVSYKQLFILFSQNQLRAIWTTDIRAGEVRRHCSNTDLISIDIEYLDIKYLLIALVSWPIFVEDDQQPFSPEEELQSGSGMIDPLAMLKILPERVIKIWERLA